MEQHGCEVSLEDLVASFNLPEREAAKKFNVCLTSLKKLCRQHNIARWPFRKVLATRPTHIHPRSRINMVQYRGLLANFQKEAFSQGLSPTSSEANAHVLSQLRVRLGITPCQRAVSNSVAPPICPMHAESWRVLRSRGIRPFSKSRVDQTGACKLRACRGACRELDIEQVGPAPAPEASPAQESSTRTVSFSGHSISV